MTVHEKKSTLSASDSKTTQSGGDNRKKFPLGAALQVPQNFSLADIYRLHGCFWGKMFTKMGKFYTKTRRKLKKICLVEFSFRNDFHSG
jgi:hypothetical protein